MRGAFAYRDRRHWGRRFPRPFLVRVSDRSDGKIAHLDGLNLSRAWCWRLIRDGATDSASKRIEDSIAAHLESALPHVTGDYMGEHWLATFALLALDHELLP